MNAETLQSFGNRLVLGGYVADAPDLGWRIAFDACGVFGMLYALPLALLLRDVPKSTDTTTAAQVSPVRAASELLSNFSFILLVLYFTLPALAGWVVRDWMHAILKQQFQIGQGKAGVAATLYWQAAAIIGLIARVSFKERRRVLDDQRSIQARDNDLVQLLARFEETYPPA